MTFVEIGQYFSFSVKDWKKLLLLKSGVNLEV